MPTSDRPDRPDPRNRAEPPVHGRADPSRSGRAVPPVTGRGRRPTMRDVAAVVGVSQQAASLALRNAPGVSERTRARVVEAAAQLGYRRDTAAAVLAQARSHRIGVVFALRHPYEIDLVEALYPAAARHGYDVVLGAVSAGRDRRDAVDELLGAHAEAIVLIDPPDDGDGLDALARQVPVVGLGRRPRGTDLDTVRSADGRGARLAVEHLIGLGHRDVVHLDGDTLPGAADRRRGYRTAMRRHGLTDHLRILPGDYTEESGADAARALLREASLPTAVFAANDRSAIGLLHTLLRAGITVPDQISVVGYDDARPARLSYVDLTTVRQDAAAMTDLAVRAAVERLDDGRTEPRDIVVDPELVVRGSAAPPPRAPGPRGRS